MGFQDECPAQESAFHETAAPQTQASSESTPRTPDSLEQVGFEFQFPAMGTLVQLKAFAQTEDDVEPAFIAAQRRVQAIANTLTDYDPKSETRQLTELAANSPQTVSDDLWIVLLASDQWYRRTEGSFDSSLGSLTRLWRKYRRGRRVPENALVQTALQESGWNHIQLDTNAKTIQISEQNITLDFGGIGKGFAVDEAFRVLQEHGLAQCLVNISGNMRLGDAPPEREGWNIEVAPIEAKGQPIQRLQLSNCAIATSGDLWQYIEIDGVRRSHILDPKTGYGVPGPISATVIAQQAIDADALATVACIATPKRVFELCDIQDAACLIARRQDEELQIDRSGSFPKPNPTGVSTTESIKPVDGGPSK